MRRGGVLPWDRQDSAGGPGPGCPKLWSPCCRLQESPQRKNGTPLRPASWGPQLLLTRVRLGTSRPRREAASASRLLGDPSGAGGNFAPWWSDSPARALLVGMGKSWAGSDLAHPGHGRSIQAPDCQLGPAGWVASCLAPWFLPARHPTLPPTPCVVSAWPPAEPNCFWWRVTHMRPQQLAIPRPASTLLAVMDPWAPRDGAPPPYQLRWFLQNHPTFLETGQQKSGELGSSAGKQWNNREACLHTHYPEPDSPRISPRAQAAAFLLFCVFLFCLHRRTVGKKNNAAQEKTKGRPQSLLLIFFLLEVGACPDVLSKVIHSKTKMQI